MSQARRHPRGVQGVRRLMRALHRRGEASDPRL